MWYNSEGGRELNTEKYYKSKERERKRSLQWRRRGVEKELKKTVPWKPRKERISRRKWSTRSDDLEKSSRTRAKSAHCTWWYTQGTGDPAEWWGKRPTILMSEWNQNTKLRRQCFKKSDCKGIKRSGAIIREVSLGRECLSLCKERCICLNDS